VNREQLLEKILACHHSLQSERIQSYCLSKGINPDEIKVAVVVQKMVNSDAAGVCFTINPVTNETHEIMIEAGYGIGEAVVSGLITPDNYIIHKETQQLQKSIAQQEKKLILDTSQ
jgi:pyruvate,water dikinase